MAASGWLSSCARAEAISPIALRRETWTSSDCSSCNRAWVCRCSVRSRTKPVKKGFPPECIGFVVTELTLGSAGEELHDSMLVDHDHRIRDCIQDRAKMPLARPE